MKTRRRAGVGALGVAVALAAATTASSPAAAGRTVVARAATGAVPVDLDAGTGGLFVAADDWPPPPPPPPEPEPNALCPVQGPVRFVDSWGFGRSGGRRHQGVDMLAAAGTPVVAPADGTVTFRDNRTGGLSYHLVAADGTYYYGTHLSAYGQGGWVRAGTVIGFVGDSGNARGTPHLHFEVHPGGQGSGAVNPYPLAALLCPEHVEA